MIRNGTLNVEERLGAHDTKSLSDISKVIALSTVPANLLSHDLSFPSTS
jgi:hypothetical protein